jgi:RHS repeat-associated protein
LAYAYTGREWEPELGLFYYRARYYDPDAGRFLSRDPIGFAGRDPNLFGYAFSDPVNLTDPMGLEVQVCCRPAEVAGGLVDHCWIRTDSVEAGMGPAGGGVPGNQSDSPYVTQTQVNDHSSERGRPNVSCYSVPDISETCVDDNLRIGTPLGRWTLTNQCRSFVGNVLNRCSIDPLPPGTPLFP